MSRLDMKGHEPWIGVDFDGTLAFYDKWKAWDDYGPPIPLMLDRVKKWVAEGKTVKIFTARLNGKPSKCLVTGVDFNDADIINNLQNWCEANGLPRLEVTNVKDFRMIELWDDRAIQVIPNTGRTLHEELEAKSIADKGTP